VAISPHINPANRMIPIVKMGGILFIFIIRGASIASRGENNNYSAGVVGAVKRCLAALQISV
jgi:hypothetical protein